jgi:hypothetical protein
MSASGWKAIIRSSRLNGASALGTDIRGFQPKRICELGSMGPRRTESGVILLRGSRMLLYRSKTIATLAGHQHPSTTRRHLEVNEEMMQRAVEVL